MREGFGRYYNQSYKSYDGQPLGDSSGQGGIGMLPKYLLLSKKKAAVQHARWDQTIMLLARLYKHGWR